MPCSRSRGAPGGHGHPLGRGLPPVQGGAPEPHRRGRAGGGGAAGRGRGGQRLPGRGHPGGGRQRPGRGRGAVLGSLEGRAGPAPGSDRRAGGHPGPGPAPRRPVPTAGPRPTRRRAVATVAAAHAAADPDRVDAPAGRGGATRPGLRRRPRPLAPALGILVLAFPAAGLLWWRLGGLRPRTRLWAGWLAGLGCYVPGLMWARSFTLAGAVVLIVVEALFMGVACLAVPAGPVVARALAFPAAMTLAEAARRRGRSGAAHRRGLPRPGRRPPARRGPTRRSAGAHAGRLRRRRGGRRALVAAAGACRARRHRRVVGFDRPSAPGRRAGVAAGSVAPGSARWPAAVAGLVAVVGGSPWLAADHAPDGGPVVGAVTGGGRPGGRGPRLPQVPGRPGHRAPGGDGATDRLLHAPAPEAPDLVLWPEDVVSLPDARWPTIPRRGCCPVWPSPCTPPWWSA